jgi:hypothetical protein
LYLGAIGLGFLNVIVLKFTKERRVFLMLEKAKKFLASAASVTQNSGFDGGHFHF